ncbi:unnamed protein product [Litomosoides sigmodontis]|uniref:Serine/threonine-protein phosphatase n=2 Tax=Onchocercidae TaxID=6296 RepID=A0A3P7KE37_LITSI|nr:unnamed protein product [Litomosoides sigmodontis]
MELTSSQLIRYNCINQQQGVISEESQADLANHPRLVQLAMVLAVAAGACVGRFCLHGLDEGGGEWRSCPWCADDGTSFFGFARFVAVTVLGINKVLDIYQTGSGGLRAADSKKVSAFWIFSNLGKACLAVIFALVSYRSNRLLTTNFAREIRNLIRCVPQCISSLYYIVNMAAEAEKLNLDNIIARLLEVRGSKPGKNVQLTENEIKGLCIKSREIFLSQPILLELEAPLKICGDVHGQYYDLLRLFEYGGFPPESNYLFLGDYVDRGKQSLETICLLLAYKIKYPENFFLLRGNHECASINRIYGFYDECKRRYNIKLWKTFTDCFNCLPVAAIIDEKIFCCHGGLSPDLQSMEQIRRIMRPTDVPDQGLLCDLLWSDPDKDVAGWGENDRGVSFTFGPEVVAKFLHKHDLDLICRAHQVVEDGYEFFAKRQLVTLFSAPNYCGEFDNAGSMMTVDETLMCSFQILKPADKKKFPYSSVGSGRPVTPPRTPVPNAKKGKK